MDVCVCVCVCVCCSTVSLGTIQATIWLSDSASVLTSCHESQAPSTYCMALPRMLRSWMLDLISSSTKPTKKYVVIVCGCSVIWSGWKYRILAVTLACAAVLAAIFQVYRWFFCNNRDCWAYYVVMPMWQMIFIITCILFVGSMTFIINSAICNYLFITKKQHTVNWHF